MPQMYMPPRQFPPLPAPKPKPPRWRFRISWVAVPAAIIAAIWFIHGATPAFTFEDLMDQLHVQNRERYVDLVTLGLILVVITLVVRICRTKKEEP